MSENVNGTNGTLAHNRPYMNRFLEKLRDSGNVRLSCKAADVNRSTVYRWRDKWSTFAAEWDDAIEDACDLLEAEAWKRARQGSDRLLMYLLTAHRPNKYNPPQRQEHSGPDGGEMVIRVVGGFASTAPDAT